MDIANVLLQEKRTLRATLQSIGMMTIQQRKRTKT